MKALTFQGRQTVGYESVADPKIVEPSDVIVRVRMTAICGSDMHAYHERERGLDPGTVMGHEFTGDVVETGTSVGQFKPGDMVFSPFTTSCGLCFHCRCGMTARCERGQLFGWVEKGAGLQGGQAEYVRVPLADTTLMPIPDGVDAEEALLLGDVFSTGYYCAAMAGVEPGGVYAVVGCGPVGLMAVIGARELGAEKLYAVDTVPARLERAASFGATPVDSNSKDPLQVLGEATEGRGADAVLEAAGSPSAGRLAYDLVRPGGTISVVGVHNEGSFAFSPAEAYDKNLTFRVGRCPARHVMQRLLPVVQERKYDLRSVISHRWPLERGPEGYRLFDEKRENCTKVVLRP